MPRRGRRGRASKLRRVEGQIDRSVADRQALCRKGEGDGEIARLDRELVGLSRPENPEKGVYARPEGLYAEKRKLVADLRQGETGR